MAATTPEYLPQLPEKSYTVGWLCAIVEIELPAAVKMLDHRHETPQSLRSYRLGDMYGHNVVIACMPPSSPGKVEAQILLSELLQHFTNLKIFLLVGIGGGVPCHPQPQDPLKDVRLGDVVVGWPEDPAAPAVIQWDLRRQLSRDEDKLLGHLNKPHRDLVKVLIPIISTKVMVETTPFNDHLKMLEGMKGFVYPGRDKDVLFEADYVHPSNEYPRNCEDCDPSRLVQREERQTDELVFHRSTILSSDTLEMSALVRDSLSGQYHNAKCFEMEAAGLMDASQCLVIRGISDYADSHKNDLWKRCAAGRAAAFAREILRNFPVANMHGLPSAVSDGYSAIPSAASSSNTNASPWRRDRIAGASPESEPHWNSSNDYCTYLPLQLRL